MSATNVQFSVGVHIMQVLHAYVHEKVTSASITESVNADPGSVRLVLAKLAKAGLVKTTRGRGGSSRLARPAHKISLLDIYKATAAPPVFAVHSHPVEYACVVSRQHKDTMVRVLKDSQAAFEAALARKKLSDIVGSRSRPR
jgi:DNA-binding IscR family transcriptional regulator